MESKIDASGMDFPATDDPWFDELQEVLLASAASSENKVEGKYKEDGIMQWSISFTRDILSSADGESQRKFLLEYITTSNGVKPLLEVLQRHSSLQVGQRIAKILRELVRLRNGKHRIIIVKQCVDISYLGISVSILKQLLQGCNPSSSSVASTSATPCAESEFFYSGTDSKNNRMNKMATIVDFIWFLSFVISKDPSAPDIINRMNQVKFFYDVFKKLFFIKPNLQLPLLRIMKVISKNSHSAEILGKEKVMSNIKKCVSVLHPNAKLIALMEWLALLMREKKNASRFLKSGMFIKVLTLFRHWAQWKGKRLLRISKAWVNIYVNLAKTKPGKKALMESEAIRTVRLFCEQCPCERGFDDILIKACAMIQLCYGKNALPLAHLKCPIKFKLPKVSSVFPDSPLVVDEYGSSSDEDEPQQIIDKSNDLDGSSENESTSDNDSLDEDYDLDDSDVEDAMEGGQNTPPYFNQNSLEHLLSNTQLVDNYEDQTDKSDLKDVSEYSNFFKEFLWDQSESGENFKKRSDNEFFTNFKVDKRDKLARKCSIPVATHKYSWNSTPGIKPSRLEHMRKQYFHFANKIKHVSPFVKIAYPDICFGVSGKQVENLGSNMDRTVIRRFVLSNIARIVSESVSFRSKVVYSLDALMTTNGQPAMASEGEHTKLLGNNDETEVGLYDPKLPLIFESRFESGNLRKAIQVGEYEYDLLLTSDINSFRHNQWFYFQVANVTDEFPYTFNIINCIKTNSLFNSGMQPMIFSVMDAMKRTPGWRRKGTRICYFRNGYKCIGKKSIKTYYTLSFTMNFHNKGDIVYIAYYIPYTYTRLLVETYSLFQDVKHSKNLYSRCDILCKSLDGNDIPLITVTAPIGSNNSFIENRDVIFITSRVHPGETNASWVVMGILRKLLLNEQETDLLQKYVFKIVPMLNIEGVVNGCHRSNLTAQDLNRCWRNPHRLLHPSIYHSKMLLAYSCKTLLKKPEIFLDLHGHSRKKNVFFYGCSFARSWRQEDRFTPENPQKLYAFPERMLIHCPYFAMYSCQYDVQKSREATARVAVWREFGIASSFTLECSYCGFEKGPNKGSSFGTSQLLEIGETLCLAIYTMSCRLQPFPQMVEEGTHSMFVT